jgi:ribonuclease VapC
VIVVDTSALLAILLREADLERCRQALMTADGLCLSAPTLVESMIVATGRNIADEMGELVKSLDIEIVAVNERLAWAAIAAYRQWGKGFHPARLNFGDCFGYALAMERGCPLLFVGDDFSRTNVIAA